MPLGGLITLFILLPNLIYVVYPPLEKLLEGEPQSPLHRLMEVIERLGQIGTFLIPFFYRLPFVQFQPVRTTSTIGALVIMLLALIFYYAGWIRYITGGRRAILLFSPMLGVPLPMALTPIAYLMAAAILLKSWPQALAAIFLAVGHLFVSQQAYQHSKHPPLRAS